MAEKEQYVIKEKQRRREDVIRQVERRKAVEETVDDLYEWIDELHAELVDAKVTAKLAKGAAKSMQIKLDKANTVASKRLHLLKCLKVDLDEAKHDLVDESKARHALERMRTIQIEIKKERPIGRRGGAKRWPVHIVLLIFKLLGNGTHPSAVPANIQSTCAAFTGVETKELPSTNFVRECRTVLQILMQLCQHSVLAQQILGIKYSQTVLLVGRLHFKIWSSLSWKTATLILSSFHRACLWRMRHRRDVSDLLLKQ